MVSPCACADKLLSFLPLLLVLLDLHYEGAECGINAEVEKHLEMGKKLLAAGQLADALSHFHSAVGAEHTCTQNTPNSCDQITLKQWAQTRGLGATCDLPGTILRPSECEERL
uniref:DnaJ homolog subfamily C member 3-like n=1 Tax=Geotrypetes seraphini TaxID=260995 RepID=A0A6P8RJF3_GEOSA|nr:dnaJ homolog subfamily C member 3-like [Geotrypetes seraphini]